MKFLVFDESLSSSFSLSRLLSTSIRLLWWRLLRRRLLLGLTTRWLNQLIQVLEELKVFILIALSVRVQPCKVLTLQLNPTFNLWTIVSNDYCLHLDHLFKGKDNFRLIPTRCGIPREVDINIVTILERMSETVIIRIKTQLLFSRFWIEIFLSTCNFSSLNSLR